MANGRASGTLPPLEAPEGTPAQIADIMDDCFVEQPEKRPDMADVHARVAAYYVGLIIIIVIWSCLVIYFINW